MVTSSKCYFYILFPCTILASNPCAANEGRGPCSHMCLINHNRSAACACPHLMKLSLDKKTCYGKFSSQGVTIVLRLWTGQIKIALETVSTEHFNDRLKETSPFSELTTYSHIWVMCNIDTYYHDHISYCLCVWYVSRTYLCKTEGFMV